MIHKWCSVESLNDKSHLKWVCQDCVNTTVINLWYEKTKKKNKTKQFPMSVGNKSPTPNQTPSPFQFQPMCQWIFLVYSISFRILLCNTDMACPAMQMLLQIAAFSLQNLFFSLNISSDKGFIFEFIQSKRVVKFHQPGFLNSSTSL